MSLTQFLFYSFSSISSSFWLGRSLHYRWSQILYQVSADENTQSSPLLVTLPFYTRSLSLQCVWDNNNQYNIVLCLALKIRKFCTYDSWKFPLGGRKSGFEKKNSFSGEFTSFRSQPLSHALLTPDSQKCLVLRNIFRWAKVASTCNAAVAIFDFTTTEDKRV